MKNERTRVRKLPLLVDEFFLRQLDRMTQVLKGCEFRRALLHLRATLGGQLGEHVFKISCHAVLALSTDGLATTIPRTSSRSLMQEAADRGFRRGDAGRIRTATSRELPASVHARRSRSARIVRALDPIIEWRTRPNHPRKVEVACPRAWLTLL